MSANMCRRNDGIKNYHVASIKLNSAEKHQWMLKQVCESFIKNVVFTCSQSTSPIKQLQITKGKNTKLQGKYDKHQFNQVIKAVTKQIKTVYYLSERSINSHICDIPHKNACPESQRKNY